MNIDLNKYKKSDLIAIISKMKKEDLINIINNKYGGEIIKKKDSTRTTINYNVKKLNKIKINNVMQNNSIYE